MGFKENFVKHLPLILTCCAVAGVGGTAFFVAKVSPEAKKRVDALKREKENEVWNECAKIAQSKLEPGDEPTDPQIAEEFNLVKKKDLRPAAKDVIKEVVPLYIPAVCLGAGTIACIVAANTINTKRLVATSTALTATEEAFRNYRDNVVKTIGEKKATEVIDNIAKEKESKASEKLKNSEKSVDGQVCHVTDTGKGSTLYLDAMSGRYFRTNTDEFKREINDLNFRLLHEDFISKNEYYYAIGLDSISHGDDIGWSTDRSQIKPNITYSGADVGHGEEPVAIIDYYEDDLGPRFRYGDGVAYSRRW